MDRRAFLSAAALGAVGLTLSTCSSTTGAPPPSGPAGAEAGAFPVTIPGVQGPITIESEPRRVVSLGQYRDTDAAVALGVAPLATPDLSKFIPGGLSPWTREALAGTSPQLLLGNAEISPEAVAALDPDLILATDYSPLASEYQIFTQIAATLSTAAGYNKDSWQVTTSRVGQALGRRDRAARMVADTERAVAAARASNPALEGRTFTIGPVQADGTINTINSETDASAVFLSQLGLRLSPAVTSLPQSGFPGRSVISPERLDLIDADVTILTYNSPGARTTLESQTLFRQLASVRRGSYVPLDLSAAIAIGFPSVLSIAYALRSVVPQVAAAAAPR